MFERIVLGFLVAITCILLHLVYKVLSQVKSNAFPREKSDTRYFDFLAEGAVVFDRGGTLSDVNPAFKQAFPEFKALPTMTSIKDLIRFLDSAAMRKNPETVLIDLPGPKSVRNAELTINKNGEAVTYLLSKTVLSGQGGYIITLNPLAGALPETPSPSRASGGEAGKTSFLSNMSREIRTPLNAIIGMTEVVKSNTNPQSVAVSMDTINDSAKNVLRIVNSALDMSMLESGQFTLYDEPFSFQNMIQSLREQNLPRTKRKNQQLIVNIDKNIPGTISADQMRLSLVLDNLLSNAVKFTSDGGHIELSVEAVGRKSQTQKLRFSVRDDGIGISENIKSKLFEAFEYTDSSFSRQFGGTGLGLAISQRIVKLMGGVIQVESVPGKGSRFSFEIECRIPAGQPAAGAAEPEARQIPGTATYNFYGHTILLAEDVEINREIVLALLEDTGARIESASNGQIAINMYTASPRKYSMVYMDIQMPILDGYAAAQKIRSLDADIPIIAMTANASADDIQKCKKCGMDDYIAKPIEIEELLRKTEFYIRRKPKQ